MSDRINAPTGVAHHHVFLGEGHEKNERRTWAVIALCSVMMITEIVGGSAFGSIALVADGLHMSTHAGAMLIAALAYTYARKHANDPRFVFGTGKLGDLAGFTSAIVLAMIALLIGYEAILRLLSPVAIQFSVAIPIAAVGLLVNIASAWLLSGADDHGHSHGHAHELGASSHEGDETNDDVKRFETPSGIYDIAIFEDGVAPVFRINAVSPGIELAAKDTTVTTIRPDGARQVFNFSPIPSFLESTSPIPEPHAFNAVVKTSGGEHTFAFEEHAHGDHAHHGVDSRDHNLRAAYIHVIADAAVSVLAIVGLLLAKTFGWLWMDPLAGLVGAFVIANWSYGLIRDTGSILMDVSPSDVMANKVRKTIEACGDRLTDLHVWRLGPGHFGVVASVVAKDPQRGAAFYHSLLRHLVGLSHITVEVHNVEPTA